MPRQYMTNVAVRLQVYLERLKVAEVREFNKVLAKLDKEVSNVLGELGGAQLSSLDKRKLNAMLKQLEKTQRRIMSAQMDKFMPRLKALAGVVADNEKTALGMALQSTAAGATAAVAGVGVSAAYAAALERPLSVNGNLLEPFLRDMTTREVVAVSGVLRRAHTDGWTNQQVTQMLRGTKALNFKDGMLVRMGRHNATLVRTSMQHVASVARQEVWTANDDILTGYRWLSTLDDRTTEQCQALDGRVFKFGEGPVPPIHMNCRSTTVAELDKRFKALSEGRTRSSMDGPVDAKLTYYGWLKQQPAAFQDSVLGSTRGQLFRDGGLSAERFAELSLSKTFQPLTLDEMRRLAPTAFDKAGL
jgi:SPP1 gp7 family putative phage head morphogenesis protein